jgi:hypothetical protein
MLNRLQAQVALEEFYPQATVKAWTEYKGLFLFRVEHPDPLEKDWDPFFSVDPVTEEVRDFSVLTDIPMSDFDKLEWKKTLLRG